MTVRSCRACGGWHNLDEGWPIECCKHHVVTLASGVQIIKDIDPYKAVAVDSRTGRAPRIGSRREHKEFLRANNYVEVGNEPIRERPIIDVPDSRQDIARTIHQMKDQGRWK